MGLNGEPAFAVIAGARPNFVKVAPLMRALDPQAKAWLVHTGQHYDWAMSTAFFTDLELREPDVNLGIGSGGHTQQIARVMMEFDSFLDDTTVSAVVVVGDVNSTLATALTAAKRGIPVAHVEAGLRSRDWSMPEEMNRVLTDRISTWLLTPSADADDNLIAEGADPRRIHLVGNVMIDSLVANLGRARERSTEIKKTLGLDEYAVLTLHRPATVDDPTKMRELVECLAHVARSLPIVFPVHPRTRKNLEAFSIEMPPGVHLAEPFGYLDFMALVDGSRLVMTDSGGLQEETSAMGIPCLTLRDNTERPITCSLGTNVLVGTEPAAIIAAAERALASARQPVEIPLWDGMAAERAVKVLLEGVDSDRDYSALFD